MKLLAINTRKRLLAPVLFFAMTLFLLSVFVPKASGQAFFDNAVENPFGITIAPSENNLVFHALVDIDSDGDLDVFVSERVYFSTCWVATAFNFYENQGSPECPVYVLIPGERFGLPDFTPVITFVDIDNDRDLDAFIGNHCMGSSIVFHENTGTATEPKFSSSPTKVLNTNWNIGFAMLAFGDLDGDGDYDALVNGLRPAQFKYLENTGTPAIFQFGDPVDNPFGLSIPTPNSSEWSQFVDWDCDGDLDILNGHWLLGSSHTNWLLYYHENTGTPTAPAFAAPVNTTQLLIPMALGDMDGDGDKDIFSDEYYYKNSTATTCVSLPTAAFSTVKNGLIVDFVNSSSAQATSCRPVAYSWDFGDGMTGTDAEPTHAYASEGTYTVCLTVEDIAGKTTVCEDVDVLVSATEELYADNSLVLVPNPANDYLTVKISGASSLRQGSLELVNPLGVVVRRIFFKAPDLANGLRINLGDLNEGIYTVRLLSDGVWASERFVKN